MMDFITIPLVVGTCVAGVYGLFELFVRRRERMAIIEKIGDKLNASAFEGKLGLPSYTTKLLSFNPLKIGCLLTGIGLGLLIAFIIVTSLTIANKGSWGESDHWLRQNLISSVYGASTLLFGGLGLIIAFIIELRIGKKQV